MSDGDEYVTNLLRLLCASVQMLLFSTLAQEHYGKKLDDLQPEQVQELVGRADATVVQLAARLTPQTLDAMIRREVPQAKVH